MQLIFCSCRDSKRFSVLSVLWSFNLAFNAYALLKKEIVWITPKSTTLLLVSHVSIKTKAKVGV